LPKKPSLQNPEKKVREYQFKLSKHIEMNMDEVVGYLARVVKGQETEEVLNQKTGEIVIKEVNPATRVAAAKVFKEITLDKLVPDVKADPKTQKADKEPLSEAIKRINAKKAEERARKAGKLAEMPVKEARGGEHG
jgi:hypothetical protein